MQAHGVARIITTLGNTKAQRTCVLGLHYKGENKPLTLLPPEKQAIHSHRAKAYEQLVKFLKQHGKL